jgi:hypothetical protein
VSERKNFHHFSISLPLKRKSEKERENINGYERNTMRQEKKERLFSLLRKDGHSAYVRRKIKEMSMRMETQWAIN